MKIGVSKTPSKRLKALQTGAFETLTIEYLEERQDAHKLEKYLHRHFANFGGTHVRGEWFEDISIRQIRSTILGYTMTDADGNF